jgi:hypothetical protein
MTLDPAELLNALKLYGAHLADQIERNAAAVVPTRYGWSSAYTARCRSAAARNTALLKLEGASSYACLCGAPSHDVDTATLSPRNRITAATSEPAPDDDDTTGGHL